MREIVLISSKENVKIKTLVVNQINLFSIKKAILDQHIDLKNINQHVDALIFTSKNAFKALLQNIQQDCELEGFRDIPAFVIGEGSAQKLRKEGFKVEYVGIDSHGSGFSSEIIPLLKNRKPLYLRAKKIVSGLDAKLLDAKIKLKQVIAYENKTIILDNALKPSPKSILIFTAPSHYLAFKQNFGWDGSYYAIAIGMTTFSVFDGDVEAFVSPIQNIDSCIEFAKELASKLP
ncbi:uroporphyrinogen-III synthase [Helicobacter cappadocius]|uniref:Uroporphyrinogen-III synthase n=1 Tax=Helicobacter cappadocius TaxID=3063998 RepID=A0AA90T5M7_9HELI|nr:MULTISPECIES: uroporphyrinogen-III synthase [unclassified Helicobacter]MDO7253694.1 uroporphyrinogen-III synthase [Helicobacter sp. faydin-H75]MDP2539618.1 uroporphyrinogen-III synthase [Helicobacter sp. faydin-H76]